MQHHVLIVDDSKLARMAIKRAVKSIHPAWTSADAANADEAMELVRTGSIDIALVDFNMPGRDGLALASELLAVRPDLPVAVISANYQDEIVSGTKRLGATFLVKPVSEAALRGFLDEATVKIAGPKS